MQVVRIGLIAVVFTSVAVYASRTVAADLEPLLYRNEGLVVDLGVGLWAVPLPMDYDGDGDLDLVVACPDKPFNGVWLFENPGGNRKMPVFKPPVRLGPAGQNLSISYVDGEPRVLRMGFEFVDFRQTGFEATRKIFPTGNVHKSTGRVRANQWKYVDFNGNGAYDLVVGVEDWADYGWDDAYDDAGRWTNGPLRGFVYVILNRGTTEQPKYDEPFMLEAGGKLIDGFGMPSPNFADFDGDGDLDLICGEFLDGFTYYENVGTRSQPKYAAGRRLTGSNGQPLRMDLQMIVPVAIDWTGDGHMDLVVGDEDGRVALIEHTGRVEDGMPVFHRPKYFQQLAHEVKFGALVTPCGYDWDGDGDDDLICGNTAGYLAFVENLDGGDPPKFAAPQLLKADGQVIRIQAGPNGSIQGPAEANWGYTVPCVCDFNGNGLPDIVVNTIWGEIIWYQNVGAPGKPQLRAAQKVNVEWEGTGPKPEWNWWHPQGQQLVTQWRTKPNVFDLDGDGLVDLVMLDHEGYLTFFQRFQRDGQLFLKPGQRVFVDQSGNPLQLNPNRAGKSGRRKLTFVDWDRDGRIDFLMDDTNAAFWRNVTDPSTDKPGTYRFERQGLVSERLLAGHDTCPTTVDFNRNGIPDLVIGAEDGRLYYLKNPHAPANSAE